jgi:hypothetical protein
MLTILFSLFISAANVSPTVNAPTAQCETYAPNLDGIRVTVCGGEVVSKCDASGVCHFSASTY